MLDGSKLRARDGINWHAHARVQKYSDDQVAWARRASGLLEPEGAFLQRHCGEPEHGYAEADGNVLVTVGLDAITKLLIASGSAQAFSGPTRAIVGVGATSTPGTIADTALGADGGSAWYQGCDSSNPTQANGVMTCVATFTTGNGNFAWNEWCWAT
ncbi:MAG: RoPhREQ1 gp62, partial [Streptosporangiaceae bacterium]|nr:RoPhREQ1 gp62 [Streptosporangiaceae bacterium]